MSPGHPLDPVFRPRSVAVVGASADPRKRGHQALRALDESGFEGRVYAVNPRGGTVLGRPVHRDVDDLPEAPELVLVCTPAPTALSVVEAFGRRGSRAAVVLAVGFRESGEEGAGRERALVEAARRWGVRLVGPNTSGILNAPLGLNLIGARGVPSGGISLVVQSGNMALALMTEVAARSWEGISVAVGVGNQADLGFAEYLDFLGGHEETRAVVLYVEGFRDARRFLQVAARVSRVKPVLALKGGRSRAGQEAARSHTGSVAGAWDRLRAAFRQAGIVEVVRTDELLHLAETLGRQPSVAGGRGVAILSDGGGQGTLAADALSELGVPLARPGGGTRRELRALLGEAAALGNPVDLAGAADTDPRVFSHALEVLLADEGVGGVLVVGLFGGYALRFSEELAGPEAEAADRMARAAQASGIPLVVHSMYAGRRTVPLERLGRAGVPVVESLDVACRCIGETWRQGQRRGRPLWTPDGGGTGGAPTVGRAGTASDPTAARGEEGPDRPAAEGASHPGPDERRILEAARRSGRTTLTEPEARALLAERGTVFPPAVVCRDEEEVRAAIHDMRSAVALKVVSARIPHKSDAGGVALGLDTPADGVEAFRRVTEAARRWLGGRGEPPEVEGVLVSPMLTAPLAELLVGAHRDPALGPVLTLGAGGIWVEVLGDVAHRVLPVGENEIRQMLTELRTHGLLTGARGRSGADLDAVVAQASAVARCIVEIPEIAEVEVNPLFVYAHGAEAVDARIFLEERG
jgi:acetyltransferase